MKDSWIDCFLRNSTRDAYGSIIALAKMVQIIIKEEDWNVAKRL
ncbi:hypothetical protein [uncultured Bacteroides sp.]|nr:hypothetical protein [uncultured Bacteroides sp.]